MRLLKLPSARAGRGVVCCESSKITGSTEKLYYTIPGTRVKILTGRTAAYAIIHRRITVLSSTVDLFLAQRGCIHAEPRQRAAPAAPCFSFDGIAPDLRTARFLSRARSGNSCVASADTTCDRGGDHDSGGHSRSAESPF